MFKRLIKKYGLDKKEGVQRFKENYLSLRLKLVQ
jgi:hypothetical protein